MTSTMCSADGCRNKPLSKGVCRKHRGTVPRPTFNPNHGTYALFVGSKARAGCRCDLCREAGREYQRAYRKAHPKPPAEPREPRPVLSCAVEDCTADAKTRGYCEKHYVRVKRHGSPDVVLSSARPTRPAVDRLLARCRDENGCWISPRVGNHGYGMVGLGGKYGRTVLAHRLTYEHFIAEIPDGLHIDHLCRVQACCNPWHLEVVTPAVNQARSSRWATPPTFDLPCWPPITEEVA